MIVRKQARIIHYPPPTLMEEYRNLPPSMQPFNGVAVIYIVNGTLVNVTGGTLVKSGSQHPDGYMAYSILVRHGILPHVLTIETLGYDGKTYYLKHTLRIRI